MSDADAIASTRSMCNAIIGTCRDIYPKTEIEGGVLHSGADKLGLYLVSKLRQSLEWPLNCDHYPNTVHGR